MDFVVIGLGLSALALLTGLTLLCLVAPRWFRKAGAVQPGDAVYARAQAGERQALGQGFLCVGAVLLLATLGGISAGLADKAGAYLIASVTTVAALGLFGWDLLYRKQHPIPPRRRAAPRSAKHAVEEASSLPAATPHASLAANTMTVRRRVLPTRHHIMPAAPSEMATTTPSALPDTDDQAQPYAEVLEPGVETTEPQSTVNASAGDHAPSADSSAISEANAEVNAESVRQGTNTEAPAEVASLLPKPVPRTPVPDNGTAELAATSASEAEADLLPHGDDRVIALFPTAAARRGRSAVAPADPDGQS